MEVLQTWCEYPSITESVLNNRRKPQAFIHGSSNVNHDIEAAQILNGVGENTEILGVAPRTTHTFGLYCSDVTDLLNASPGDVAFTLRAWTNSCRSRLLNPGLPTITVFGIDNQTRFVGNDRYPRGILISTGYNYGKAIDYYASGGAQSILGGGNTSFALPEFAGMIVALNSALIANNRAPLDNDTIKEVLDASSDQAYMEISGVRGVYHEDRSNNKYFGQIVNLPEAIRYALVQYPRLTVLTLLADVQNTHGGNANIGDFDLRVSGGKYDGSILRHSGDWVDITSSESYTLSTDLEGYELVTPTPIKCVNDDTGSDISYPLNSFTGDSATCTISVKDIAPNLRLLVEVTNEDEGALGPMDFDLHLSGSGINSSNIWHAGDQITVESNARYSLTVDSKAGYTQTSIVCRDDASNIRLAYPVILNEGQSANCTVNMIDRDDSIFFIIPMPGGKTAAINL